MGLMKFLKLSESPDTLFVKDEIKLKSGSSFKIKDWRGFTVAEFDEKGNLKIKGSVTKTK
jgi:hypothetical protein